MRREAERLLRDKLPPGTEVHVRVVEHERPPEQIGQIGLTAKSVIAVGSGKGGVGKSTIAASLAYGLKNSRRDGRADGCRRLRAQHSALAGRQRAAAAGRTTGCSRS